MENLLAMPVRPVEVMLAKIIPYVGHRLSSGRVDHAVSAMVFQLPVRGSLPLLLSRWACSSPRTSPWASPSRPWRATRCRRCRWRNSRFCPRSCCRASCSRSRACRYGRDISASCCRSPMRSASRGDAPQGQRMPQIWPDLWPMVVFAGGRCDIRRHVPRDAGLNQTVLPLHRSSHHSILRSVASRRM